MAAEIDRAEREALRRIKEARDSRGAALDLAELGLRTLPRQIGELDHLCYSTCP